MCLFCTERKTREKKKQERKKGKKKRRKSGATFFLIFFANQVQMDIQAPDEFTCAITRDIMEDPVVAADGHSYERAAITHWLSRSRRSPMTNAPMYTELVPNIALRKAICEWRTRAPLALDPAALTVSDSVLGVGSFGTVLAGTLKTGGREQRVAVKTISAATQAEQRRKFAAELRAHIVAQQGADGVCRLLGTCEKSGVMYLVMRRYERSLADRLVALAEGPEGPLGRLGESEVRRIGHSLCITLEQLHGAGVIVSDIKPQNVLFDAYDRPVFADFGIAALVGRTTRIVPTCVRGSFNYMAPEALEPPFGVEADVWSMACLLFEMHTGQAPWGQMQMQQIVTAVLVRRRTPDVPDSMPAAETIKKCFAFAPRDRPTAGALAAALSEVTEVGATVVLSQEPRTDGYSTEREAAAVAQAAALREERDTLKAQLTEATKLLERKGYTKIFKISLMHGSSFVSAEIEMIPSILVSESTASVAAAFHAFVPSVPLKYELRTFYTGHQGAPHELFAIIVSAEWGSRSSAIPSHMLHMIGPREWIYHDCQTSPRPEFKPTRQIGMNIGDIFLHSEPRQPAYQYPCGPHAYSISPNTKSFGICVNGAIYGRGDRCMDGLVIGRLKDTVGVINALLGTGSLPRYFQCSLPR